MKLGHTENCAYSMSCICVNITIHNDPENHLSSGFYPPFTVSIWKKDLEKWKKFNLTYMENVFNSIYFLIMEDCHNPIREKILNQKMHKLD